MTRRTGTAVVAILLVPPMLSLFLVFVYLHERCCLADSSAITEGMTIAQVENILSGQSVSDSTFDDSGGLFYTRVMQWYAKDGVISVGFDRNGNVTRVLQLPCSWFGRMDLRIRSKVGPVWGLSSVLSKM